VVHEYQVEVRVALMCGAEDVKDDPGFPRAGPSEHAAEMIDHKGRVLIRECDDEVDGLSKARLPGTGAVAEVVEVNAAFAERPPES
jgi:hypothetical protein